MSSKSVIMCLVVAFASGLATPSVMADRMKDRQKHSSGKKGPTFSRFGIRAGIIGDGSVTFGTRSYDSKRSYSFGLYADQKAGRLLRAGLAIDIYDVNSPGLFGFKRNIANVSVEVKAPTTKRDLRLVIQPGIGIGFGFMQHSGQAERAYLLTVKLFAEMLYFPMKKHGLSLESGLIFVPVGSANDVSVTAGPTLVFRGGLFI